jgi:gallate dioxygenase
MARILGAVTSSHSPTIGFAMDRHKQDDPVWARIFDAYRPVQQWLAEKKSDVLFLISNVTSFFFDHDSHFALGIGESYAVADEGGGARALPRVAGHPGMAQHIGSYSVAGSETAQLARDQQDSGKR